MSEVIFAVPGSKVYINRYYKNHPKSFLNISMTGTRCSLMCGNCKGSLLRSMLDASIDSLTDIVSRNYSERLNGILVSGGFNRKGILDLSKSRFEEIKDIKQRYPALKVLLHCGFADREMAKNIRESSVDGVLINIISSKDAVEDTYRLKGYGPEDYYSSFSLLKDEGLEVAPHIVTGLGSPELSSEYRAVDKLMELGSSRLVFVVNKRLGKGFKDPGYDVESFIRLVRYARQNSPDMFISFGCAQPAGKYKEETEKALLDLKINSMAFPSEKAIEHAKYHGIDYQFRQECCAIL